ncbi:MAG: hypothetical protein ACW98X_24945, partial [Promethearchaeota archaeon]
IIGSTREKVEHIIFALETGFAFLRNDWKYHQKSIEHIKSLDMKDLLKYWAEKDKEISREMIREDFSPVVIQRTNPDDYFKMNGDDLLLQYILHTVYHRGQLNHCLQALDKDRIEADYLYFFDELNIQ